MVVLVINVQEGPPSHTEHSDEAPRLAEAFAQHGTLRCRTLLICGLCAASGLGRDLTG